MWFAHHRDSPFGANFFVEGLQISLANATRVRDRRHFEELVSGGGQNKWFSALIECMRPRLIYFDCYSEYSKGMCIQSQSQAMLVWVAGCAGKRS
jgi:hypothetical protein